MKQKRRNKISIISESRKSSEDSEESKEGEKRTKRLKRAKRIENRTRVAAVVHGLSFANSNGAFRLQLLR